MRRRKMTDEECSLHAERLRKEQRKLQREAQHEEQPSYQGIITRDSFNVLVFHERLRNRGTFNLDHDGIEITAEQEKILVAAGARHFSEEEITPGGSGPELRRIRARPRS